MSENSKNSKSSVLWTNFHATESAFVDDFYTYSGKSLEDSGQAVSEILSHCFDRKKQFTALGSTWSLSDIGKPQDVAYDAGAMNNIFSIEPFYRQKYIERIKTEGITPVYAQSGVTIHDLNGALRAKGLALPTSGASDGHRLAGCISTGTHGAAHTFGALHDCVSAVHIAVAPDKALLIQGSGHLIDKGLADYLARTTGIPTTTVVSETLLHTARVSLGCLGYIMGYVLETVPCYALHRDIRRWDINDSKLWDAFFYGEFERLYTGPGDLYHVELILTPYPKKGQPNAFSILMGKTDQVDVALAPKNPTVGSDALRLIGNMSNILDDSVSSMFLEHAILRQIQDEYKEGLYPAAHPSEVFGPTNLPAGVGMSTELAVPLDELKPALSRIFSVLKYQKSKGVHLLGPIALRVVGTGYSHMGLNKWNPTCYIELPSIKSPEIMDIYKGVWMELRELQFAAHWGQQHDMDKNVVRRYFGFRRHDFVRNRNSILTPLARFVFGNSASRLLT